VFPGRLLLDYDIVELDAIAEGWISRLYARAKELYVEWSGIGGEISIMVEARELHEVLALTFPSDPETLDLQLVDDKDYPPSLDERAKRIRAMVNVGTMIKLAHGAYAHQITHRNTTANHLLHQLFGYRPGLADAPAELFAAFALGCLLALDRGIQA
jgi:hypothetical protein